ncbi:MarC family protein [Methyloglobulus sp.]|uniref:MarC family protein n=1 Tax=Methyloglobulus sp. TaxID=2518622 RepID=UPI0032B82B40
MPISQIFTYFMVMLGPIKILAPFVKISRGMDTLSARMLAVKGFFFASLAGVAAATLGKNTLANWGVGLPSLLIAAGLVLLLVALKSVLAQYEQPPAAPPGDSPQPSAKMFALSPLAFPIIITPYGIAAFILIDAAVPPEQNIEIYKVFLEVMVLNLVAMLFARPIIKYFSTVLIILGAVLGVLQVALAVQMILLAFRMLGVLP